MVAGGVLFLAGGATIVEGSVASTLRTVTYDQLVREAPRFGWVFIEDATVDLNEAFAEGGRGPNSIYVPVRSRASVDRQPGLLLRVDDEDLTFRVNRGERFTPRSWRVEGTISLLGTDNRTEGLLAQRFGIENPSDVILIESGNRPLGILIGLGISALGVLLFLTALWVLLRRRGPVSMEER